MENITELERGVAAAQERYDALSRDAAQGGLINRLLGRRSIEPSEVERARRDRDDLAGRLASARSRETTDAERDTRSAELLKQFEAETRKTHRLMAQMAEQQATNARLADEIERECASEPSFTGSFFLLGAFRGVPALGVLRFWDRQQHGTIAERLQRFSILVKESRIRP